MKMKFLFVTTALLLINIGIIHGKKLGLYRQRATPTGENESDQQFTRAIGPMGEDIILPTEQLGLGVDRLLQTKDYQLTDSYHRRILSFFDPEFWARYYPGYPFPSELDIPSNWAIYNPVTVQAPKPTISMEELRSRRFTGFYYACPSYVNPFKFSWYMRNERINPCKWIFYQTWEDANSGPTYPIPAVGRPEPRFPGSSTGY